MDPARSDGIPQEQRFDDLTKALARPLGRRVLIKGLTAVAFGGVLPLAGFESAAASGNNACDLWCNANFSGRDAGSCISAAARHSGPCYQCGPASPNGGQGQAICRGKCTSVTTTANCGACGHACACPAHGKATCVNGQCGVACDPGYCGSGGACYPAGAVNPANACQTCHPGQGAAGWVTKTCTAGDQCHGVGQCDPATGLCTNPDLPNGTACNDNNSCTGGDTCQSGVCTGGAAVVCTPISACYTATCDPVKGCQNTPAPAGTPCSDSNSCTIGDACDGNGTCVPGQQLTCPPCQACNQASGTCVADPSQAGHACPGDGNLCFGSFACDQGGNCAGVQPVTCAPLDGCHVAGICAPATGLCSNPNAPDGTTCADGNVCTHCQAGVCTPISCDDDDACTIDSCDPVTGCFYTPVNCDDGNPCTVDTCDPVSGCVHTPDNSLCPPDNACFTGSCDPVLGCVQTPVNCNDDDACTIDSCDPVTGCFYTPVNCDDGIDCTFDTCDPVSGCIHTPDDSLCSSSDPCMIPKCDPALGCTLVPKDCDDGNPCTVNSCFGGICSNTLNTALCNDGLKCTTDTCVPAPGTSLGYVCEYVFEPTNCGKLPACQTPMCGPGQDCAIVYNDDLCPAYPNGVTCLVPVCGASGCGYTDTCGPSNPQCNGCADCSCNVAVNECVPTCPS